jgi:hypothetical protein
MNHQRHKIKSHPPYHLRLNKAIDRFILIEAIRKFDRITDLSEYTYYGFGGPYLEDFRLLNEFCPEIGMVSIEEKPHTVKQQKFHQICKTLKLTQTRFNSFLTKYNSKNKKSIFWLDYTKLELVAFEEFQSLLEKVALNSIIKITLQAVARDYLNKGNKFRDHFSAFMPDPASDPPLANKDYAALLQDMLQIAAQKILPATGDVIFQPLSSFFYADGANMFTLTGIVCTKAEQKKIRALFKSWSCANLTWKKPKEINIPFLSTKERFHLQKHLPLKQNRGRKLLKVLGYTLDGSARNTAFMLTQYADFYRYYPYFVKAMP